MERKVRVPESISEAIGRFGIDRTLLVNLENILHHGTQIADRTARYPDDDRCFVFQVPVDHLGKRHLFVIVVDDSTSPDDFFIQDIKHITSDDL